MGCEDDGSTEDDDRSVEDVDEEALLALSHLELVPDGSVDRAGQENSFVAIAPSSSHTPRNRFTNALANPRDGRHAYCDHCDCGVSNPRTCMASLMLQQVNIQVAIEEWQLLHERHPERDVDKAKARFALYRAVVGWIWANPLGAENRVRLPACVVKQIRQLFRSPKCTAECDFFTQCERLKHYVGFRTASESQAMK